MPINKIIAEYLGTGMLLLIVAGSGVMGESLSQGNAAVALLANSIATGCGLYVLINLLAPISGAHLNPIVSLFAWRVGELDKKDLFAYIAAQVSGAISGIWLTHLLFALPVVQYSTKPRHGLGIWVSELIATLILLAVIHLGLKYTKEKLPMLVALTVMAGYWFTSSTFFANPAVTIARSLTNTFVGISPGDVFGFITAQFAALILMMIIVRKA
ncbi:MAG TPA: MIP/aquaporin family protein [Methylotenera sp.]|nr:MIP/aquaporin family protein [Methylotenera sp.]